jgi:phosphatidate cytidylyltransferase
MSTAGAKPSTMGNLASRVLVAIIAIPILLVLMYQPYAEVVWLAVFPASLVAMYEFFAMAIGDRTDRWAGLAAGAAAMAALYWVPAQHGGAILAMVVGFAGAALYYLFRFGDMATVGARLSATVTGIFYGGLLTFVAIIKRDAAPLPGYASGHMLLLVLLVPWISDTGAYVAGRAFGKRKMYPAISPGKTWAGGVGGIASAVAAAAGVKLFALPELLSWVDVLVLGIPGGLLCQLGDLVESLLKRSYQVKDSGTILGGHGGLLDRVDAVLLYAPFVYLYWRLVG